jgi:phage terminase large subunit-like protein
MAKKKASASKKPAHISVTPARAESVYGVPLDMYAELCMLPGFDPFRDAGDCTFDVDEANKVTTFFEKYLQHVKGKQAKKPFLLEPWQKGLVWNLFAWKREDGTRRFRKAFIYIAKKNGKTALAAGLLLYVLACDNEPGAELYGAAASKEQAKLVFQHADGMVKAEPELSSRLKIYGARGGSVTTSIVYEAQNAAYKVLAADEDTADGINPHFAVIDELHRFSNSAFIDVVETSAFAGQRAQPLVVMITTADTARPESPCNRELEYARKVITGTQEDPEYLPVVYEAAVGDDIMSPETWLKANPNLDVTVTQEAIGKLAKRAKQDIAFTNSFKRLHLNIVTEAESNWIDRERWESACVEPRNDADLRGYPCYTALDLGSVKDLCALAQVWRIGEGLHGRVTFWTPKHNLEERERRDKVPYLAWVDKGFIEAVQGRSVNYAYIAEHFGSLSAVHDMQGMAYDQWKILDFMQRLEEQGIRHWLYEGPDSFGDGIPCYRHGQGPGGGSSEKSLWMPRSVEALETGLLNGSIKVETNPCLTWACASAVLMDDKNGNRSWAKKKSTGRIDGIVALSMAVGLAEHMKADTPAQQSCGIILL